MWVALIAVVTVALLGCSPDTPQQVPTGPTPPSPAASPLPPAQLTWLWGVVVDKYGGCIAGATVQVVRGQGAPGPRVQQRLPCDAWDGPGFEIRNLTPGEELTLRAEALGYAPHEITVVPHPGPQSGHVLSLSLL
jgi:hypothetical protein